MDWRMLRVVQFTFLLTTLVSCAPNASLERVLYDRLRAQGPILLDSSNPYISANLFLAKQSELSPELKGFLKIAGTPGAIEVQEGTFSSPVISLYYPAARRFYSLDQGAGAWVISGPFNIPDEVYAKLVPPVATRPALRAHTGDKRSPSAPAKIPVAIIDTASPANVPFASPVRHPIEPAFSERDADPQIMGSISPAALAPVQTSPEELAQLKEIVARYSDYPAELSPRGDLVHYVTYPGESLSIISRWYTLDESNNGRLARVNQLKNPQGLTPGDTVIIPSYMLQNRARLTEDALAVIRDLNANPG